MSAVPQVLLDHLHKLEPAAQFTATLPKITSSAHNLYFAKIGSPSDVDQYIGEAESLKAMYAAAPGLCPRVFAAGVSDGKPYFLSEYKDLGSLSNKSADVLAKRIATEMHLYKSTQGFGFAVPTYCGATRQDNGWFQSWEECFGQMIGGLLDKLQRKGSFGQICSKGEEVREKVVPKLLGPLKIDPVLLHGDLWSGNTGTDRSTGQPIIFDPSSFYGHNEADLAIGRMFGGIPKTFFTTYHKHQPKTEPVEQYELRGHLYELYHYLNHVVLFGSGYADSAMDKIERLLEAHSTGLL